MHAGPFFFVAFAAGVDAAEVGAGVAGDFVEPAGDGEGVGEQRWRFAREEEEDGLGGVFGAVGVVQEAAGVGVDLREVAGNELRKGGEARSARKAWRRSASVGEQRDSAGAVFMHGEYVRCVGVADRIFGKTTDVWNRRKLGSQFCAGRAPWCPRRGSRWAWWRVVFFKLDCELG